jgi:hypothetical protein
LGDCIRLPGLSGNGNGTFFGLLGRIGRSELGVKYENYESTSELTGAMFAPVKFLLSSFARGFKPNWKLPNFVGLGISEAAVTFPVYFLIRLVSIFVNFFTPDFFGSGSEHFLSPNLKQPS